MTIELTLCDSWQQARLMLRARARIMCMVRRAAKVRCTETIEKEGTGG